MGFPPDFLSLIKRSFTLMAHTNWAYRVYRFYADGFRSMTLGRTLWAVILIKLFIMFAILRLFFFPDILGRFQNDIQKGEYVRDRFIEVKP